MWLTVPNALGYYQGIIYGIKWLYNLGPGKLMQVWLSTLVEVWQSWGVTRLRRDKGELWQCEAKFSCDKIGQVWQISWQSWDWINLRCGKGEAWTNCGMINLRCDNGKVWQSWSVGNVEVWQRWGVNKLRCDKVSTKILQKWFKWLRKIYILEHWSVTTK